MKFIPIFALTVLAAFTAMAFVADDTPTQNKSNAAQTRKTTMNERTFSETGHDITRLSQKQVDVLAAKLDPETFKITQKSGTERPFCGTLLDNKKDGFYACVVCGLPLFSSEHKFTSGTGWPSFHTEYDPQHVARISDRSHGMTRTEIECTRCGAHLGHVFPDGPPPSGERHCLNSASLTFIDAADDVPDSSKSTVQTAYFAGGCFWGIEHYLQKGPGVLDAVSGYMNGDTKDPTYKEVCSGTSGHAEVVKVTYDPSIIDYDQLLMAFFLMHDPTQLNRQGPDVGTQYRSGVYTTSDEQLKATKAMISRLEAEYPDMKFATQVEPAETFYPAEDYHQNYIETTGRSCHVRDPWPAMREAANATPDTAGAED